MTSTLQARPSLSQIRLVTKTLPCTIFPTQLLHIQLCLCHNAIFHTQLCHTIFHKPSLSHTHNFVTHYLSHTLSRKYVSHHLPRTSTLQIQLFKIIDPRPYSLSFRLFFVPLQLLFLLLWEKLACGAFRSFNASVQTRKLILISYRHCNTITRPYLDVQMLLGYSQSREWVVDRPHGA